ncbi:MAG: pteridine reductase [Legionellales bacterium RIFCSPHIGHO2_12_FULL_42_9]|nr:MAG: pteridine reductase [Legionellales bacterium RIFCSPHIGHO2_12_FULL_42_9]
MKLENKQPKVALITGAARRIGAEIACHLHQSGFRVVIHCYQSLSAANQLAQTLNALRPDSALVVQADLSLTNTCDAVIEAAIQWAGRLDLLINNASVFAKSNLNTSDLAFCERLYALNVFAPWHLSIKARPWLETVSGNIINITDIHSEKPLKGYAEYCQSKAALTMQTKTLAREFAPHIRVNAVAPGAIAWPEQQNTVSEAVKNQIINETPLKIHGQPKFIAEAVLALIANPFITGQLLRVDGGRSIG